MNPPIDIDQVALETAWLHGDIALKDHVGNDMGKVQRTAIVQVVCIAAIKAYLEYFQEHRQDTVTRMAGALAEHGIDIACPWDCDLDDLEQERFNGLVAAWQATLPK